MFAVVFYYLYTAVNLITRGPFWWHALSRLLGADQKESGLWVKDCITVWACDYYVPTASFLSIFRKVEYLNAKGSFLDSHIIKAVLKNGTEVQKF